MKNNFKLVARALFIAIILIQTTVPGLGYLPIGPLSLTIIPVTVIIASITLGTTDGMLIGGIWGLITFIRAFFWPTSPLAQYVFINPLVSVLPRILIGLVAGITYKWTSKTNHQKIWLSIIGAVGSLTNTVLLLGMVYVFYNGYAHELYQIDTKALLPYLLTVFSTNGLLEALIAVVLTPLIAVPLIKFTSK
ncbi:ECF transporter S component [Lactobacillus sp. Sy-1]|uniref:ECF transporter S component n=1 Tax=Lactobacillus sp. Sy-1 TaxID=2109645 RepID=UPI001C598012|nr:ECF transporter S component [Lactobacillus sp. Sy-1]MBW1605353.1 ECF transporter S component [Lactobacillus sp. Sy-1]